MENGFPSNGMAETARVTFFCPELNGDFMAQADGRS
jgi:hypothetical protein